MIINQLLQPKQEAVKPTKAEDFGEVKNLFIDVVAYLRIKGIVVDEVMADKIKHDLMINNRILKGLSNDIK